LTSISRLSKGCLGNMKQLKIEFRKECWFDSGQGTNSASHVTT
jgi:hypothetical protein